ncbi:MAG TPA: hypothetical protein VFA59_20850 [Vicinamibacterales bacterium]|nr:hypothetical protein [Vicinamibacterales bacterium]
MSGLLVVTLVSMVLAVVMSAIAWRASREEKRRADLRIESLAADIQDAVARGRSQQAVVGLRGVPWPSPKGAALRSDLFAGHEPTSASSRSVVVVGLGLLAFATVGALAVVFSNGSTATALPAAPSSATAPATVASPATPLELVALGQERDGDRLIVRGVIQNPPRGSRIDHLVAVVFLFDRDGNFLTSGRAVIDDATLVPGGESSFTVNIPGATNVARYRVSFRTESAVVPHVDKRHG